MFLMITSCSCLYLLLCVALILIGEVCLAFYYLCNVVSEEQCKWQSCVVCLSVCEWVCGARSSCLSVAPQKRARIELEIARIELEKVCKRFANMFANTGVPFPPGNWWFAKAVYEV